MDSIIGCHHTTLKNMTTIKAKKDKNPNPAIIESESLIRMSEPLKLEANDCVKNEHRPNAVM
jgi:hypothetical protein